MTVLVSSSTVGRAGATSRIAGAERRINIVQGEYNVSADPEVVLTTILGSCVAACMYDPEIGVGGMNHFLLPGNLKQTDQAAMRHGVHAMELLVNGLLRGGAKRERLEAKLFGGARMISGLTDVGRLNGLFAEEFLKAEGIKLVGSSLGGVCARRIQFWPFSGRTRQMIVNQATETVFDRERTMPSRASEAMGDVEIF